MARTNDVLDDLAQWYGLPGNPVVVNHRGSVPRSSAPEAAVDLRSAVRRGLIQIAEVLLAWHDRARQRRTLMKLSDHALRDIGIARADACREAARPFWRS